MMRHEFWGVLVAAVGILATAGLSSHAAEASHRKEFDRTSIIVRTYTHSSFAEYVPTARRTAGAILEQAGIRVVWFECALSVDGTTADACMQPTRWNELLVRIVSADALAPPDVSTLGFALVDRNAGRGALAAVYADRVSVMAQDAGVADAELLGRTMAHELGHLLLGTNRHAAHGLMRGSWSSAELRQNRASQWLFGSKESEAMLSGLASRFRS